MLAAFDGFSLLFLHDGSVVCWMHRLLSSTKRLLLASLLPVVPAAELGAGLLVHTAELMVAMDGIPQG